MKKELPRKLIHVSFGTFFLALIYYLGTTRSLAILSAIFLIGLFVSILIKNGVKFKPLIKIIQLVERDYEQHLPGKAALLFFLAALILLYLFKSNQLIVLAGLSTAVYGDAAAALIGKAIGKTQIGFKNTLAGTLSCFIVCIACITFFFPFTEYNILIILVPAIIATIAEYLPINDNLAMPIGTSTTIYLLLLLAL
jgi:dolichol kinase